MSRSAINFLLDCILLGLFVTLVAIAVVIESAFPAASAASGWALWGLTLDEWLAWQFRAVLVFAVAVGLHLILHWTWVCGFVAARLSERAGRRITTNESTRTVYGVMMLIVILIGLMSAVAAAQRSVRGPSAAAATADGRAG